MHATQPVLLFTDQATNEAIYVQDAVNDNACRAFVMLRQIQDETDDVERIVQCRSPVGTGGMICHRKAIRFEPDLEAKKYHVTEELNHFWTHVWCDCGTHLVKLTSTGKGKCTQRTKKRKPRFEIE